MSEGVVESARHSRLASLAADVAADLWSDLPDRGLTGSSSDGMRTLEVSGDHAFPSAAVATLDAAAATSDLGGRVSVHHDSGTATLVFAAPPGFDAALLSASIADAEAQGVEVTRVSQGAVSIARASFDDAAIAIMRALHRGCDREGR